MKVILIEDHIKLGEEGTIVDVASGYARNFLLPKKLAYPATEYHIKLLEQAREKKRRREEKKIMKARELAGKLGDASCTITVAAGEGDTLYGSVTTATIAEALNQEGFEIDKRQIHLEAPIKKLGIYSITVSPAPDISAQVKIWVVK
ncbi:MAG: 50S ribosomal protein L9 [Candidatus Euphemobacter frigidus]|nr:50S ribosomal protein L9 [Candidatus Euphemobacter frigidus]MDP8275911.1 50S ribosomal protein L9 [Candidatus Euphemobacter frigidus]